MTWGRWSMEPRCAERETLDSISARSFQGMTTTDKDPRHALDTAATSIKNLVLDLEQHERDGKPVTASEIKKMASQLKVHVEDLLAASKNLSESKKSKS